MSESTSFVRRTIPVSPGLEVSLDELGEGAPVLLLHGSGPGASGLSNFAANMRSLAGAGYRAIAIDLFGYGASSKPVDRAYSIAFQSTAVKAVLDGLGLEQAALVGNSMGGAVALRFTLDHPERVSKLVLLAPGGLGPKLRYAAMPGIRAMMWTMLGPGGPTEAKLRKVFGLQLFDASQLPDSVIHERLAVARTQPRQVYATLEIDNLVPRLSSIRCPTLVFWGSHDNFCPVSTAHLLTRHVPDCRAILVSRCGHWVQVERPDLFDRETLAFLKGGVASQGRVA